jgi:hypothetical protein
MESRPRPGVVLAWVILGGLGLGTFIIASPAEKPIVAAGLGIALVIYIIGQVVGNAQEKAKRMEQGQVDSLPRLADHRPAGPAPIGRRYDASKAYTPRQSGGDNGDGPHLRVL